MRIATCFLALAFAVPVFAAPDPAKPGPLDDSAKIAEKLLERISVVDQLDKAPFRDALKFLQDRTGLNILVDVKALRDKDAQIAQTIDDAAVSLPAMKNVRGETVLRKILDQVELDYVIMPDHVSVTTTNMKDLLTGQAKRLPELYSVLGGEDESAFERTILVRSMPYLTVTFKETAAADAFKEIASQAGRNIVISQAAAEKAKNPVTMSLSNVAFETAAASLAEAAGLRAFRTGNVVVIVTPERAKQIEDVTAKANSVAGLGGPAVGLTSDGSDTRIKELEEKVKKLMDELEKSRKRE